MTITARCEDGVFKRLEDVAIIEGTIVEVRVPSYADCLEAKVRSVGDLAFYGMSKDRTTPATASNTSAIFGVICGAKRFHPHA
jgi:predicted DNA-binding antitoxin AbrB/MazE fold protein